MYSAMARRRTENNMQQLMCEVERLNVFRLLVEEVADGVCVLTPDETATVLFTNASFSDYLRIPPYAVLGRCVFTHVVSRIHTHTYTHPVWVAFWVFWLGGRWGGETLVGWLVDWLVGWLVG
jgi:PAS domain-containing protein